MKFLIGLLSFWLSCSQPCIKYKKMRLIASLISCLGLNVYHDGILLHLSAKPFVPQERSELLVAQTTKKRAIAQWELDFRQYTWKDGSFSIKIPGSCPVERPGAKCGFPEARYSSNRYKNNLHVVEIDGGNYEVAFTVSFAEYGNLQITPKAQQDLLSKSIQFNRRLHEEQENGRLNAAYSGNITVNGHKGVDLWWDRTGDGSSVNIARIVVAGNRVYTLRVAVFRKILPMLSNDVELFLNSFSILKTTK